MTASLHPPSRRTPPYDIKQFAGNSKLWQETYEPLGNIMASFTHFVTVLYAVSSFAPTILLLTTTEVQPLPFQPNSSILPVFFLSFTTHFRYCCSHLSTYDITF
jgi:hypothetical protein